MQYRREIDGLRALAVLPVILFHAGFEAFSGGFVGVDVFFVISGYLITTIIVNELDEGKFSIINFYERRARRILPALFFVMLICIPFAWVFLAPPELTGFSRSLVAVPLFFSNFFFWKDGGYFEVAAELKPLLHTWSLAVEEQFYVIFPLVLMLSWKLGKRWILNLLGLMLVVSLAFAEWASLAQPSAAFYLLPARGWELLIGACAAFYLVRPDRAPFNRGVSEVGGWLGVVLIVYSVFSYSKAIPFPGLYALVPALGATLIILFATQQTTVGRFVGNRAFVSVGLISYSAYLWHQPVLAYARHQSHSLDFAPRLALIAAVGFLAFFTWKYVEAPFRLKNGFNRKFIFSAAVLGGALFVVMGLVSSKLDFETEERMAKELSVSPAIYSSNINERTFIKHRIRHEQGSPDHIFIGSSRLMQAGNHNFKARVLRAPRITRGFQ